MLPKFFALFANLDERLLALVEQHGGWSYAILFLVLMCEVGLVVTPFVPGETLLFAANASFVVALVLPLILAATSVAASVAFTRLALPPTQSAAQ